MAANNISSIFGASSGLTGSLSDYNAIRSGSYRKLLKSYYGKSQSSTGSSTTGKSSNVLDRILEERRHPTESKEASTANATLTSSVTGLTQALSSLQNEGTYKDTENGSTGRTKATNALKNYVSAYNDAVKSSKKSTMSNVSSNIAGAMKATKENEEALKELGITIQNDGTLYLDEKKLSTADTDKIKDLFDGSKATNYGSTVESRLKRASYYVSADGSVTTGDSTATTAAATSSSKSLMESVASVKDASLYTKDEGNILAEVETFIKHYNTTLSSSRNSTISGVTSNLAAMMQKTSDQSKSLASIGISVGTDGKLTLDKDVFGNADKEKGADILKKYASAIETNARLLNFYATSQNTAASGYSPNGEYSANSIAAKLYDTTS